MEITRGKIPCAKKVVIYGPEGIGKSTFASQFPEPVFIDTEGSTNSMDVARLPKPTSWQMLLDEIQYIKSHPDVCKTLVIDTIPDCPESETYVKTDTLSGYSTTEQTKSMIDQKTDQIKLDVREKIYGTNYCKNGTFETFTGWVAYADKKPRTTHLGKTCEIYAAG